MEKFKCIECDYEEVEYDGDMCDECAFDYDDTEEDEEQI